MVCDCGTPWTFLLPFLDSHLTTLWESNCPFDFLLVIFPLGFSYFEFVCTFPLMSLMGGVR